MADAEDGSSSVRKNANASPHRAHAQTLPGGFTQTQVLIFVIITGLFVFGSTVFYYQSILHAQPGEFGGGSVPGMGMGVSLGSIGHPMVKNDLSKWRNPLLRVTPGFNAFSEFGEKNAGKSIKKASTGISSNEAAAAAADSVESADEVAAGNSNSVTSGSGSASASASVDREMEKEEEAQARDNGPPSDLHPASSQHDSMSLKDKQALWALEDRERLARMASKRKALAASSSSSSEALPVHHLTCPGKELVQYWSDSTLDDWAYETPYKSPDGSSTKYVTFEPDVGGWNNIRMQMELVLVFAAATGRTLVLPPDQPMYLLNKGKGHQKEHSFADFFPFDFISKRVPVISMKEFIDLEARTGRLVHNKSNKPMPPPSGCDGTSGVEKDKRNQLWDYLRNVTSCPPWKGMKDYLVIPPRPGMNTSSDVPAAEAAEYAKRSRIFAGDKRYGMDRQPRVYDQYWHDQHVIHFISKPAWGYRLLEHFYTYIHFQDPAMDRLYKRFVRDYVHYVDLIFCKSALIIQKLLDEGGGVYSSFHVRRGEFQYKSVKIPAAEMLANVGHLIPANRLVFIATDERDKSFFDAFKARWPNLRFLDDYMDMAGLKDINPNFLGMIDATVCTRGEQFVGTWFSTFSGYITRMRGYMNYPDSTTWYGDKDHRDRFQAYEFPRFPFYMRENAISWFGIDEDHKDYWDKYFKKFPYFEDPDPWGMLKKKQQKAKAAGGGGGGGGGGGAQGKNAGGGGKGNGKGKGKGNGKG